MICYNLACYEAQLDHLAAADQWLERSFERAKSAGAQSVRYFRGLAAEDPDLEPLRAAQENGPGNA
jgi:hypothetical protein